MKLRLKIPFDSLLILLVAALLAFPLLKVVEADKIGAPSNTTMTLLNVTNAPPFVLNVIVTSPINLHPNGTVLVYCNGTVQDYNGWSDITLVNATLFEYSISKAEFTDHNRTHYSNSSCLNVSSSGLESNFSCEFTMYYYADNSTWRCNMTAYDTYMASDNAIGNGTINTLIALTVPDVIDYGAVAVTNSSQNIQANLTNVGNKAINITMRAYGRNPGDNTAMVCTVGNITYTDQHYTMNPALEWISRPTPSNNGFGLIANLTIAQMNNSLALVLNTTNWILNLSSTLGGPGPAGVCNGTVEFTAIQAG